jgi:hypothetical protein
VSELTGWRRRLVGGRARVALVAVIAVVAAIVVWFDSRTSSPSASGLPPLDFDPGVVHIHGLGVDPGDGALYAATHSGLFRLPTSGGAIRIANRAQDTMGFSVVGPGTFIGSGHPDFREDDVRPPLLGLIESKDAGTSWTRLSLHGQADFHVLQAAHGQVYGYDSTSETFMVSRDRKSWERRAKLPLLDFVVSPTDADQVVAANERALLQSNDGGRTFREVKGAPVLAVLGWPATGPLYGVSPSGAVYQSRGIADTWTERGGVGGVPEAITVDSRNGQQRIYVAVVDQGVRVSSDGGKSFATRYRD